MKKSVLLLFVMLLGCNQENTQVESSENANIEDESQVDNQVDEQDVVNYYISSDKVLSTEPLEREWNEGYNLSKVEFKLAEDNSYFEIINTTPRYIYQPKIYINSEIYQIDAALNPFEVMKVSLASFKGTVKGMKYIDEQPMFKATVKQYGGTAYNISEDPIEENALQYEEDIRGLKSTLNDYELAIRSLTFIDSYHEAQAASATTRTTSHMHEDGSECMWDTYLSNTAKAGATNVEVATRVAKAVDTSTTNAKILSLYAWAPEATYTMLRDDASPGALGVATLGNGWLTARARYIYQEGSVYPREVYFHEKMHNHGFNHSGGMTYGIPDQVLLPYVKGGYWFDDYYDEVAIATGISPVATTYQAEKVADGTLEVTINFFGDKTVSQSYNLDKFVLIPSDNISIAEVKVIRGNEESIITPLYTHAEGKVEQFGNDLAINISDLDTQSNDSTSIDSVVVTLSNYTHSDETLVFMGTSADQGKVQANTIIELAGLSFGMDTGTGTIVFTEEGVNTSEDGTITTGLTLFTPEEAGDFCASKGLELGLLPATAAEKIELQKKYLIYRSQVGVNPTTGVPEAYNVPTGAYTNLVTLASHGALVVCQPVTEVETDVE